MILDDSTGPYRHRSIKSFFFCLFYAPLCPSCCVTGTYSHGLQQIRELLQDESQITAHFPLREFGLIPHNPLRLLRGLETPITTKDEQRAEENARLTPCVAQLAACSYSVGWYLLLAGTLQFMNLRGGVGAGGDDRGLSTSEESGITVLVNNYSDESVKGMCLNVCVKNLELSNPHHALEILL